MNSSISDVSTSFCSSGPCHRTEYPLTPYSLFIPCVRSNSSRSAEGSTWCVVDTHCLSSDPKRLNFWSAEVQSLSTLTNWDQSPSTKASTTSMRLSSKRRPLLFDFFFFLLFPRKHIIDVHVPRLLWHFRNFWSIFKEFDDKNQRRLLQFITASDRYPATGIANLSFKITCMGSHDSQRYPTTHTCFNQLCLYNYKGRDKLKNMLQRAMNESEGFGVK